MTEERRWDSTLGAKTTPLATSNAVIADHGYDGYGNPTSTTNGRGFVTALTYDSDGKCVTAKSDGSGARNFTYGSCDPATGLPSSATDSGHQISRTFGYDAYGRNTSIVETGGSLNRNRATSFNDGLRTVTASADLTTQGDAHLSTTTYIDPQGRTRETVDVAGNIVQSRYYTPAGGPYSYRLVSNPYVSGSEPSMGWTLATLDRLGRTLSVQHCNQGSGSPPAPVGTVACSSTGTATVTYGTVTTPNNFSTVTSTDEAGVARTDYFDGLGRLAQVAENNGTETTTYAYDALDNLTSVSEPNAGGRTFTYSSLSRLTNASNPENGNTSYTYDANGNLLSRTQGDATHGFKTISYTYDNLDQLLGKSYSDGAPAVTFSYSADWLQSVSVAGGTTWQQQFDGLGRATSSSQATNGTTYTFPEYLYNLADLPTSVTTPTGRVVTTSYDSFGRAISVSGVLGDKTKSYVSQLSYAPHGGITAMLLGNQLWESMGYNNQLQQTSITLGTSQGSSNVWGLTNGFSATQNNGNVASQSLTAPGLGTTIGTGYAYDGVNRLQKAMENASNPGASACGSTGSQWCRFYGYGQGGHGNAAVASSGGASGSLSPQEPASCNASNHIADADANWQYGDGRGNVTTDGPGNTFVYDAENRQVSYCGLGSICTAYTYDGAGRRVIASNANGTTVFVYDAGGNLAAEYATTVQTTACATCYVTTDHLGSARVVTDDNGCAVFRQDYMPFGMAVLAGTGDPRLNAGGGPDCVAPTNGYMAASPARTQFTGQERDVESGLDHFPARFYSGASGRFTSADPLGNFVADPGSPQSWNMYAYVYNNPLKFIDPTGLCSQAADGGYNDVDGDDGTFLFSGACVQGNTATATVPPVPFDDCQLCELLSGGGFGSNQGFATQSTLGLSGLPSQSNQHNGTPWNKNSCITGALGNGLLHVGIDAIGLIPEGGIVSRAIGNSFKYRGIVADQFGNKTLGAVQMATGIGSAGVGSTDTSGTGSISTGLGVAGIANVLAGGLPVVGQAISVAEIGVDILSAGKAIANCK